jgi:hypothetical protein
LAVLTAWFAEVIFGDIPVPRKPTGELGVEEVPPTERESFEQKAAGTSFSSPQRPWML